MDDNTTHRCTHPVPIPAPSEQRWVVMVIGVPGWPGGEALEEPGSLCTVDAKTGGPASIYDPETWSDADRSRNRAAMMELYGRATRFGEIAVGFVNHHGRTCLPCGHPVGVR